jgi:hypothetical protein
MMNFVPKLESVTRVAATNQPFEFATAKRWAFPGNGSRLKACGERRTRERLFKSLRERNWSPISEKFQLVLLIGLTVASFVSVDFDMCCTCGGGCGWS